MRDAPQNQQRLFHGAVPSIRKAHRVERSTANPWRVVQDFPEAAAGVLAVDAYQSCECGCLHCAACCIDARGEPARLDHAALAASLDALRAHSAGRILIGTQAEPYPQLETRLGATRVVLKTLLRRSGLFISLHTRSPLSLRDSRLLRELATRHSLQVHICLPSSSESLVSALEPRAPSVRVRLAVLRRFSVLKVPAGLRIAPVAPGLNDSLSSLEALVRSASECGARFVSWDVLSLTEANRERFLDGLAEVCPSLLERLRRIYSQRPKPSIDYQRLVATRLNALKRKYAVTAAPDREMEPVQLAVPMAS